MAVTSILRTDPAATLASIEVDVVLTESHSRSATITESPIELGSTVTDHINIAAPRLFMEGVLSNRPPTLRQLTLQRTSGMLAEERYDILLLLFELREPFTVVTGLRTYENMVFENFNVERDVTTDKIVRFTAELVQLEFAIAEQVPVPDALNDRGPKANTPVANPSVEPEALAEGTGNLEKALNAISSLGAEL